MRFVLGLSAAAVLMLVACGDDGGATPDTCLPDCPGVRTYDATSYHLSASFDWSTNTLHAVEDIALDAPSDIVELDADVAVTKVSSAGQALAFALDRDAGTLRVDVGPLRSAGASVAFTVEYTAQTSDALIATSPRDDDPTRSRVVYTDSEPNRGLRWLVAKHDPSDRAKWSVDVTVPGAEDVVANGTRVADQRRESERTVSYVLRDEAPTYLMAFAAGELDHRERTTGRVPLELWFRRGLLIDPDDNLDAVANAMATFESLIGPYPWESYAVVLLPGFGGGMENATITFNDEGSGQGAVGFSLNAHELAHHWFGDWVTMRTYDDVWVKEGMATFLAAEATRMQRDRGQTNRNFGNDFGFYRESAIVDPSLTGLDKYDSGPYERAAWLITQVRVLVGDVAFWDGLRKVQRDHAISSVTGPEFLASFPLAPADLARLVASLTVKEAPWVTTTMTAVAGGTAVDITLFDPLGLLIVPPDLEVVDAAGAVTRSTIVTGTPFTVTVPDGGFLRPDPSNLNPPWQSTFRGDFTIYDLLELYAPSRGGPAFATLASSSPSHQETAMGYGAPLPDDAAGFAAFYAGLDSDDAKRTAVIRACGKLRQLTDPVAADALAAELELPVRAPAVARYTNYAACGPRFGTMLRPELAAAAAAPTGDVMARLEYLLGFDYGTADTLALIGPLVASGPSVRLRDLAIRRLADQVNPQSLYAPVPEAERPAWRTLLRARLPFTTSRRRLLNLWYPLADLEDVDALPLVAPLLHSVPTDEDTQATIVCDAHRIAAGSPGAWEAFQAATMPWSTLSPRAAAALADPLTCGGQKRAPRRAAVDGTDANTDGHAIAHDHARHLRAR